MGFVEEELAQMWCELLSVAQVTPESEFSALGGGADTAAGLVSRIEEELGVRVAPADLAEAETLDAMARLVRTAMEVRAAPAGTPDVLSGPRPGLRQVRPSLSFAQQRLWFMQQIDPATTLYNVPTVLSLRGTVDRAALAAAYDALVARHEVLRTTYAAPGGKPHQVIADTVSPPLPFTDLSERADAAEEFRRIAAEEAGQVFDLAAAPPVRARLIRLAADDHRLAMTFHHIAIGGWSLEIFYRELGVLYGAAAGGTPGLPAEADLQYADYAAWQRESLDGEVLDGLVRHWRAALGDNPKALVVPADRPPPAARSFKGAFVTREISPALVRRLRDFSRKERSTLYMTTLAGFDALLAGWSGTDDITVGTPVAGRTRPELEDVVGCLINLVPVRVLLDDILDFRGLLARVRTAMLDASAHQDLPFDKLVEALVTRRGRDFLPVFRVMFSFLKERPAPVFPGVDACVLDLTGPQDTAKYELSLYAEENGPSLSLTLEYDTDLFGPDTPAALLAAYEQTLEEAVTSPHTPVLRLPAVRFGGSGTERSTHDDR